MTGALTYVTGLWAASHAMPGLRLVLLGVRESEPGHGTLVGGAVGWCSPSRLPPPEDWWLTAVSSHRTSPEPQSSVGPDRTYGSGRRRKCGWVRGLSEQLRLVGGSIARPGHTAPRRRLQGCGCTLRSGGALGGGPSTPEWMIEGLESGALRRCWAFAQSPLRGGPIGGTDGAVGPVDW
ncbi:hypothetical protein NDU88_005387 [Pleurodeles waltl]|uniref:Uncharacterized protein n=1 Tax=Pleurodeles waltl TaxID=8319 RepID=A0AAV7PF81_PLEWA|nr:hypothetical protein NDU88_005387 [Pleurodeles waltl]